MSFTPLRAEVEAFARDRYKRVYDTDIKTFAREIIVLSSESVGILSCVGIGMTTPGDFFVEQYLDEQLEEMMSETAGIKINIDDIST